VKVGKGAMGEGKDLYLGIEDLYLGIEDLYLRIYVSMYLDM
jgi:hypothetical protein